MRRREKFVLSSLALSAGLFGMQFFGLAERYVYLAVLVVLSYLVTSWALSDDLQRYERFTIVPFSAMYTGITGLFYFLLPQNTWSLAGLLIVFAIGMYALLLAGNIFSVAKGRSIQLLHAAHAIQTLATIGMSLLLTNVLFSFGLSFWWNGLLLAVVHFPLLFMTFWSFEISDEWERIREALFLAIYGGVVLLELGILFSLAPFSVWNISLFVMSVVYLMIGIGEHHLKGKLFRSTLTEYTYVFGFLVVLFIVLFPKK